MNRVPSVNRPEKLSPLHAIKDFDCGDSVLNDWLSRRALPNEVGGASRTYVVCAASKVLGYYSLSAGAVAHAHAPGRIRRNMPDPVPVMVLGRSAVDRNFHGKGLGTALLRDAVLRVQAAAEIVGIRAILVHALGEPAKRFYENHGFVSSPIDPLTVFLAISELDRIFNSD